MLKDPEYVSSVLSSLPGVDPEDPTVKNAVQNLQARTKDRDGEGEGKDGGGKGADGGKKDKK